MTTRYKKAKMNIRLRRQKGEKIDTDAEMLLLGMASEMDRKNVDQLEEDYELFAKLAYEESIKHISETLEKLLKSCGEIMREGEPYGYAVTYKTLNPEAELGDVLNNLRHQLHMIKKMPNSRYSKELKILIKNRDNEMTMH